MSNGPGSALGAVMPEVGCDAPGGAALAGGDARGGASMGAGDAPPRPDPPPCPGHCVHHISVRVFSAIA